MNVPDTGSSAGSTDSGRAAEATTLTSALIRVAHRHFHRFAMADARRPRMTAGAVLLGAIFFARRLKQFWREEKTVGILLPPSVPAALVNFAATLAGKAVVNFDYTMPQEMLEECAKKCGVESVVTLKVVVDYLPVKLPGQILFLDEAAAHPSFSEKRAAMFLWPLPARRIERKLSDGGLSASSAAAKYLTETASGGFVAAIDTHAEIAARVEAMQRQFGIGAEDTILGALPFCDSFGYETGLWLPAISGAGITYHTNALDAASVSETIRDYQITVLPTTADCLEIYTREWRREDVASLRVVFTGDEIVPEALAKEFESRFGVRPMRG